MSHFVVGGSTSACLPDVTLDYKESIQIEPFYRPAYLDLARAYLMLKDLDNAYEILDRPLKIEPGNDAAREAWLKLTPPSDERP